MTFRGWHPFRGHWLAETPLFTIIREDLIPGLLVCVVDMPASPNWLSLLEESRAVGVLQESAWDGYLIDPIDLLERLFGDCINKVS